jgi:hypothetical protein
MYAQRNIEARSYNHCYSGTEINITYSEGVLVALGIQHAMRMRLIVICRLPFLQHSSTLSHGFQGRDIEHKMCVLIFSTTLSETFLILRRNDRDTIKNVHWSSRSKYPLFLSGFNETRIFSTNFIFCLPCILT